MAIKPQVSDYRSLRLVLYAAAIIWLYIRSFEVRHRVRNLRCERKICGEYSIDFKGGQSLCAAGSQKVDRRRKGGISGERLYEIFH